MSEELVGIVIRIPIKLHRDFKQALLDSCDDRGVIPSIKGVVMDMMEQYVEAAKHDKKQNKADSREGS